MNQLPDTDPPLMRLGAELDDLRSKLSTLRGAIVSGSLPVSLDERLGRQNNGESPPARRHAFGSDMVRLLQACDARVTALRAAVRQVQTQITMLETSLEHAEREASQYRVKRADVTARLNKRDRLLNSIQNSAAWKLVKPVWKLFHHSSDRGTADAVSGDIAFGIDTPERWETDGEILVIKGWCLSQTGRDIAGVRGKIGSKGRMGRYGIERTDVAGAFHHSYGALRSGFVIEMPLPPGASTLRLEAIVQGADWECFFTHPVRREGDTRQLQQNGEKQRDRKKGPALPRTGAATAAKAISLLTPLFRDRIYGDTDGPPRFSVITPTFNTQPRWLTEAAMTLLNQSFNEWEWCLVDDGSTSPETRKLLEHLATLAPQIRVDFGENGGISSATNRGLSMARGEFVCFLDHDDLLDWSALAELDQKVAEGFDVVYSDEDKIDDATGRRMEAFHKPEWSPEYFRGVMYIGHLLCVRAELARAVRFDPAFDGVQDYDFMLRLSETGARIGHIPKLLYHWRKTPGSIAQSVDAKPRIEILQANAVNAHLARLGFPARARPAGLPHRLHIIPEPRSDYPRISVIIPTRDAPKMIGRCLAGLFERTTYPDLEVVLIDNETTDPEALDVMARYSVKRVPLQGRFNFSRANNIGARASSGAYLVFLNNDTDVLHPDWLQNLLYYAEQPDIGAAGALLVYDNGRVQHAGVALGMRGTADHLMREFPQDADGYGGSLVCAREVSAVTAACMMMRKALFDEVGGFNEHFFTAYQDLDLCLRLREKGLRIIYTPQARVVHEEWTSRKTYYDMVDRMLLLDQWEGLIEKGDPYYNRHLNLERGDYSLRM